MGIPIFPPSSLSNDIYHFSSVLRFSLCVYQEFSAFALWPVRLSGFIVSKTRCRFHKAVGSLLAGRGERCRWQPHDLFNKSLSIFKHFGKALRLQGFQQLKTCTWVKSTATNQCLCPITALTLFFLVVSSILFSSLLCQSQIHFLLDWQSSSMASICSYWTDTQRQPPVGHYPGNNWAQSLFYWHIWSIWK